MSAFLKKAADPLAYAFWKTQIGLLRRCPPLSGLVFRYSFGSANSRRVWAKTLLRIAARVPGALASHWRNVRGGRTVLSYVTIYITTRCTLNCDKCAAHIPDLKRRRDTPLPDLIRDIRALLRCADGICDLMLCGGEPFLHPGLGELLRICADSDKIDSISVVTNGTVIPSGKLLGAFKDAGVTVRISRYDQTLAPRANALRNLLKENGIRFTYDHVAWRDMGGFGQAQEGPKKRRFGICAQQLNWSVLNGKLHLCCTSAFLVDEGLLAENREDFIDLRAVDPAGFRGQLKRLLGQPALLACSYCLGNTYKTQKIPPAIQRRGGSQ